MNRLFLLAALLFFSFAANAQTFEWAKVLSSNSAPVNINDVATDTTDGSIYVIGDIRGGSSSGTGIVDINPGTGVKNVHQSKGGGFFAKYDAQGNFLWGHEWDSTGLGGQISTHKIRVNPINGDLYIFGWYSNTSNFDPQSSSNTLNTLTAPIFQSNFFIAVYNRNNGAFKEVREIETYTNGSDIGEVNPYSPYFHTEGSFIEFDKAGNLTIGGYALHFVDFDLHNTGWAMDFGEGRSFMAMYDTAFSLRQLYWLPPNFAVTLSGLRSDNNCDWYFIAKGQEAANDYSMLLIKVDSSATLLWEKSTPMTQDNNASAIQISHPNDIVFDKANNLYIKGVLRGTTDFDFGTGTYNLSSYSTSMHIGFLAKYTDEGDFIWAKHFGNTANYRGVIESIGINKDNQIVTIVVADQVSAQQRPRVNLNNGTMDTTGYFIVIYDTAANLTGIKRLDQSIFYGNMSLYQNKIRFGSGFGTTVDFDLATSNGTYSPSGTFGAGYFAQYNTSICTPVFNTVNESICNGDTYMFNGNPLTVQGTYTDTFLSSQFCDSVVTLNLSTIDIDTSVTVSAATLTANQNTMVGLSYQWIDCSTNTPVPNSDTKVFTPPSNTTLYRVKITLGGCEKESSCFSINSSNVNEITSSLINVKLYPNPAQDNVYLDFEKATFIEEVQIYDVLGKRVDNKFVRQNITNLNLDLSKLATGTYHIKVLTRDGQANVRVNKY